MSIQNDGITERSRGVQAAYERGYRAGIEAAAKRCESLGMDDGYDLDMMKDGAKEIRALAAAPDAPDATGADEECPDCNDGILTRAFAEPHDTPCPTCNGTMRAPPATECGRKDKP